jgi:hypothetical protein
MNIHIVHPGDRSMSAIEGAIETGEAIKRSPHVGNVNHNELSLVLGLNALGAHVELEIVDTIRGSDNYSSPRHCVVGDQKIPIASSKEANKVVGACQLTEQGQQQLADKDFLPTAGAELGLQDVHQHNLVRALPADVMMATTSESFTSIGSELSIFMLTAAPTVIDRPLRAVGSDGKIDVFSGELHPEALFGIGEETRRGIVPPLEVMMAAELLRAVMDNGGNDAQSMHVAGPDMIRYTKDPNVMNPTIELTKRALAHAGVTSPVDIAYVLPCMATILGNTTFDRVIDSSIQSQYDILIANRSGVAGE